MIIVTTSEDHPNFGHGKCISCFPHQAPLLQLIAKYGSLLWNTMAETIP